MLSAEHLKIPTNFIYLFVFSVIFTLHLSKRLYKINLFTRFIITQDGILS
jgi:hypothetical protein